jgi:transmembrane sensor
MNADMHDTAFQWQLKLDAGPLDAADEQALAAWLARDPAHRIALAEVGIAYYGAVQVHPDATAPAPREAAATRRGGRALAWIAGAAAAPLMALAFAVAPAWWAAVRADAHTGDGVIRTVTLPDGSRAVLDADSALAWDFDGTERRLRVLRGAAWFEVRPDASRPFRVSAGELTATAVGTAYAVDAREAAVEVSVSHGVVQVDAPGDADGARVVAGEHVRDTGGPLVVAAIDQRDAAAGAWREGLLSFHGEPLHAAFARLERYVPQRILLLGDARGATPVDAVFPIDDASLAVEALARSHGLRVRHLPGLIVLGG